MNWIYTIQLIIALLVAYTAWQNSRTKHQVAQIHVLVNSAMTAALRSIAALTADKARITNDPKDVAAALAAQKVVQDHANEKTAN